MKAIDPINSEKPSEVVTKKPAVDKEKKINDKSTPDKDTWEKDMAAEHVAFDLLGDEDLEIDTSAFGAILTQTPEMLYIIQRAERLSRSDVPVLINGQAGCGKGLFAKSIHRAGKRKLKPFIAVKCAAILSSHMAADFFGCVKNAMSGVSKTQVGWVEQANGGTLFLDEFHALPAFIQVQLLKIIRTGEYQRVGDARPRKTNIRIIAATAKNLTEEVRLGRLRADLFYAISIGVLHLPPLCERRGDLFFLANYFLKQINQAAASRPGYVPKKLSAKARTLIVSYSWPGNVSELYATLLRATLWTDNEKISYDELKEAMLPGVGRS